MLCIKPTIMFAGRPKEYHVNGQPEATLHQHNAQDYIAMMFIAAIWLGALVWALISGRAYVLRFVSRAEDPIRYWLAVGVYGLMFVVLVSLGPVR